MVCLSNVTVSCLFDALPKERVRKDFRRPRFSFFRFNCQTAASLLETEASERLGRSRLTTLAAEPASLRSLLIRVWLHPRSLEKVPNRAGRVSSDVVDGRLIAPAFFGCQQPIQKKFEKVHFPSNSGRLRRTIFRCAAVPCGKIPAPNLGHDRGAWSGA